MGDCAAGKEMKEAVRKGFYEAINAIIREIAFLKTDLSNIDIIKDLAEWAVEYVQAAGDLFYQMDIMYPEEMDPIEQKFTKILIWVEDREEEQAEADEVRAEEAKEAETGVQERDEKDALSDIPDWMTG